MGQHARRYSDSDWRTEETDGRRQRYVPPKPSVDDTVEGTILVPVAITKCLLDAEIDGRALLMRLRLTSVAPLIVEAEEVVSPEYLNALQANVASVASVDDELEAMMSEVPSRR